MQSQSYYDGELNKQTVLRSWHGGPVEVNQSFTVVHKHEAPNAHSRGSPAALCELTLQLHSRAEDFAILSEDKSLDNTRADRRQPMHPPKAPATIIAIKIRRLPLLTCTRCRRESTPELTIHKSPHQTAPHMQHAFLKMWVYFMFCKSTALLRGCYC